MAVELASGYVSISPSAKGFGNDLNKQIGPDLDKVSRQAGDRAGAEFTDGFSGGLKKLAAVAAGAFATIQVGSFFKGAVDSASDLNETVAKVGVVLGADVLPQVEAFAEGAATSLGQSKQAALDAAATFGVFGKSAGLTGPALASFSTDLVQLSSDMASFSNTTPDEAIEAIGAALRGESEPIRSYGVLLDDATLRQRALKLGIVSTTKNALTPQQRVLAAQAEIFAQTSDAQGDFARTSGGLANQQRILAAQLANSRAELGKLFLPAALKLVTVLNTKAIPAMQKVGDTVKSVLVPAFRDFKAGFADVGKPVEGFAATVGQIVGRIVNYLKLIPPAFAAAFRGGDVTSDGLIGFVEGVASKLRDLVRFIREDVPAAINEFKAAFKTGLTENDTATPIEKIALALGAVRDIVKDNPEIKDLVKDLALVAGALVVMNQVPGAQKVVGGVASQILSMAPFLLTNPFGIAAVALGALAGGFVLADKKIKPFSESVDEVQKAFKEDGFGAAVEEAVKQFDRLWDLVRPKLELFVSQAKTWIKDHIADLFGFEVAELAPGLPIGAEPVGPPPGVAPGLPMGAEPIDVPKPRFDSFSEGLVAILTEKVLPAVGRWFTDTFLPFVNTKLGELLSAIGKWIRDNEPAIVTALLGFSSAVVKYFDDNLIPTIREKAPEAGKAFAAGFALGMADLLGSIGIAALDALGRFALFQADLLGRVSEGIGAMILATLDGIGRAVVGALGAVAQLGLDILDSIGRFTVEAGAEIAGALGGLVLTLLTLPERFFDAADGIWDGMWDGIYTAFKSALNFVIRAWNDLEFKLPSFSGLTILGQTVIPGFEGPTLGTPNIPELAGGGVFNQEFAGLLRLAETPAARPEIVTPQRLMAETFRAELAAFNGGGRGGVTIEHMDIREQQSAARVVDEINTRLGWMLTTRAER